MDLAQLNLPKEVPNTAPGLAPFTVGDPAGFGTGALTALTKGFNANTIGGWISAIIPFLMVLGGLILFGMLLMGGFEIATSMGNQEKMAAGAARIKNALIGFVLLFAVVWVAQIVQVLFKIQIL